MNPTTTPAPTPGMGTGTEHPTWDPDLITAISLVGRVASIPGTPHVGVVLTVDGPTWQVVAGADGAAHVWTDRPSTGLFRSPEAEVRWHRPVAGLRLLSVPLADLAPGVSLHKA